MAKGDYVHGAYHKQLEKEMNRVLNQCKNNGMFITKKDASAVVAEKSRRGTMNVNEIKEFLLDIK